MISLSFYFVLNNVVGEIKLVNCKLACVEILVVTMSLQKHVFLSLADLVVKEYCTKGLGFLVSHTFLFITSAKVGRFSICGIPYLHHCMDFVVSCLSALLSNALSSYCQGSCSCPIVA
jgi:hypothetical protein